MLQQGAAVGPAAGACCCRAGRFAQRAHPLAGGGLLQLQRMLRWVAGRTGDAHAPAVPAGGGATAAAPWPLPAAGRGLLAGVPDQ